MSVGVVLADRYEVESELGHGGFGVTHLARDRRTGGRCVVKTLRLKGLDTFKTVELFEREARVLKALSHPRIPRFIDFFTDEQEGRVAIHLVQEFVAGKNLAQLVSDGRRFSAAELVDIGLGVASLLAHLHGLVPPILHRDIKPSNVMLTPAGEVHLIDFGAVRDRMLAEEKHGGGASTIVGTYGYMPIEQFEGRAVAASDVYSLGATLIFLASHREPWTLERRPGMRLDFESVCHLPPAVARVVARMVAPDVRDRHQSAPELVRDLERLRGMAATGFREPARRAVRVGAIALGAVALAAVGILVARRGSQPTPPAPISAGELEAPEPEPAAPAPLPGGLDPAEDQPAVCRAGAAAAGNIPGIKIALEPAGDGLPAGAIRRFGAAKLRHNSRCNAVAVSPDGKLLATADDTISLWDTTTGKELRRMRGHCHWIHFLAFSRDGKALLSGSNDRSVRRWDVRTGRQQWWTELGGQVSAMSPSADGRQLVVGTRDNRVALLDAATGRASHFFEGLIPTHREHALRSGMMSVSLSPDRTLVAASDERNVHLWKVMTGKPADLGPPPATKNDHGGMAWVAFDGDRALLVATSSKGVARWDLDGRKFVQPIEFNDVPGGLQVALAPDRKTIAVAGVKREIQIVELPGGRRLPSLAAGGWYVSRVAFSPDGRWLASAGWDARARLWDWRQARELLADSDPVNRVYRVDVSPDGAIVAGTHVFSEERHEWDLKTGRHRGVAPSPLEELQFALVYPRPGGHGMGWSSHVTRSERVELKGFIERIGYRLALSHVVRDHTGALSVIVADADAIRFLDPSSGRETLSLPTKAIAAVATRAVPDAGAQVEQHAPSVRVWFEGGRDHEELAVFEPRGVLVTAAAFSPNGKRIVIADERGVVTVWDTGRRKLLGGFAAANVRQMAFTPDGQRLALLRGGVEIRSVTGEILGHVGHGHRGAVTTFALTPDGRQVVTGGSDTTILLWPMPTP